MIARLLWLPALSLLLSASVQAAERVEEATASTLELRSNAARITIEVEPGNRLTLRANGPAEDLDKITIGRDGATFSISGPPPRPATSNVVVGSVTNFATNGSVAVTRIGGGTDAAPPVEFHLTVPPGTRLVVDDLTGELSAGDLRAPVRLSVSSATVRLGRVGSADLRIDGAGEVKAAGIDGDARLALDGSGSIEVATGKVGRLDIDLTGAGDITAAVTAREADIDFSGVGTIKVDRVLSNPTIREDGVGEVLVGH